MMGMILGDKYRYDDEEWGKKPWDPAPGGEMYTGKRCLKCRRIRVYLANNGKHRCEKCGFSPEENQYVDRFEGT